MLLLVVLSILVVGHTRPFLSSFSPWGGVGGGGDPFQLMASPPGPPAPGDRNGKSKRKKKKEGFGHFFSSWVCFFLPPRRVAQGVALTYIITSCASFLLSRRSYYYFPEVGRCSIKRRISDTPNSLPTMTSSDERTQRGGEKRPPHTHTLSTPPTKQPERKEKRGDPPN